MSEHDDQHGGLRDQTCPCPQPRQRLPNELLYYIIGRWCSQDFLTLRALIYVNKLFFHAAAPHLWSNPIERWDLNNLSNIIGFIPDREKLMATMFASLLEARLLEQEQQELGLDRGQDQGQEQSAHGSRVIVQCKSDAQRVDDILKPFGLCVAKGVQSPFLRRYLMDQQHGGSDSSYEDSNGRRVIDGQVEQYTAIQASHNGRKADMTINYSKYFGSLSVYEWHFLDFDQIIHLRSAPQGNLSLFIPSIDHSNTNGVDSDGKVEGVEEDEEHEDDGGEEEGEDEEEDGYNEEGHYDFQEHEHEHQLTAAIASLLLHYNSENITNFELDIELAPKCLVFAPKMAKLRKIYLERSEVMSDNHLESMILFIRRNMEAFPRKPPLKLALGRGWYSYERNFDDFLLPSTDHSQISTLANETAAMEYMRRECSLQSRIMKSKIALWEAIQSPHHMTVSMIPQFYEQASNMHVQLDRLHGLTDEDAARLDYGEGPGMQAFLRKCSRIRKLLFDIGSKDVFTWAAEEALIAADQPTSILSELLSESEPGHEARLSYPVHDPLWSPVSDRPRRSGILPNLEALVLNSECPYRLLIYALNDAMVAFASSLRTISVRASSGLQIPNDWHPASILARRRARLSMPLYNVPWANTIGGGTYFLPFPLPHLKKLTIRLHDVASVQIGSFAQCLNVEEIRIQFGDVVVSEMHPDDRALLKPSSSIPITPENMGDMRYQQARIDRSLFPVWNLPHLQTLVLEDLAAMRFNIQSIYNMQCLEILELCVNKKAATWCMTEEYVERQTSAWKSNYDDAFSRGDGSQGDDNTRIHPEDGTGSNKEKNHFELWRWSLPKLKALSLCGPPATMFYLEWFRDCPKLEWVALKFTESSTIPRFPRVALPRISPSHLDNSPMLHSCLKNVSFEGPWNMSDEDMSSLRTIYAPFLSVGQSTE